MGVFIKHEIADCSECKFHTVSDRYSSDGWDRMEDWTCTKSNKKIAGGVEWHDKIPVPNWCEILVIENSEEQKQK